MHKTRFDMADISLSDADRAIIAELEEGRNTPSNIARETGNDRHYVSSRLKRLREHGVVTNIGGGVYQLIKDEIPDQYHE
jgi:DNA-binding Lrp family transcriptional regulator